MQPAMTGLSELKRGGTGVTGYATATRCVAEPLTKTMSNAPKGAEFGASLSLCFEETDQELNNIGES